MIERPRSSTRDKAIELNLDDRYHGTFAEIGAGQEVARWFFRVGGAAGTVAKTMSAYDMKFSDAIYGPAHRYVSRERLLAMLDHEYGLLIERLDESRGERTAFFAFANTVAARSHSRKNDAHGWVGLRFQDRPRTPPSQVILHTRLLDADNFEQQQALGILGVNLVHGALFRHAAPVELIQALLDELSVERLQVDMIELGGPAFAGVDNRVMSLKLVEAGFTDAALFRADGAVVDPADALYKRPVLVERGDFRPVTRLHEAILKCAAARFRADLPASTREPLILAELTLRDLSRPERPDPADFLARVDTLATLGFAVLVSRFGEYYALAEYLCRYTNQNIGLASGVPSLRHIFEEQYYANLKGGILEAIGRLFARNVRLYAYPERTAENGPLISSDDLELAEGRAELFRYLRHNAFIQPLKPSADDVCDIRSDDVLERLRAGDGSWESLVPAPVAALIKERGFFGYRNG